MTSPDNPSIEIVSGGGLRLDGGNMFGPVPRTLWERKCPPDQSHRIPMETNCLLVRTGDHLVLIDTGYGGKASPKQREFQSLEEGEPLLRSLSAIGVDPGEITVVVLTHLHFDHVGGCTRRNGQRLEVVFPKAMHFVHRDEWQDATGRVPELLGSYFEEDFLPLEESGLIEQVGDDAEILPGIRVRRVGGHTRGMQLVEIGRQSSGSPRGLVLADLAPSQHHLRTFWTLSYDQFPLDVRRTKPVVLGRAADEQIEVFFTHDVDRPRSFLKRDDRAEFICIESKAD